MSPTVRVVGSTLLIIFLAYYYSVLAVERAEKEFKTVAPFNALISDVRSKIARSPHPELYQPGERFGFTVYAPNPPTDPASFYAFRYAFVPATLIKDPNADRVVVVTFPHFVGDFEAQNRVRLLDSFSDGLRVYQRVRE